MRATTVTTSTTTDSDRATAPRHRDEDRPTRYGPHFTRRAASIRRAIENAAVADLAIDTDPKDTQR